MAVSDEISRIKGNIASAYTAASGKGATLPDVQNSANLAGCIDTITGGGEPVEKTKFGASIDTWIGDVDANGVLWKTTWTGALNFTGVKKLNEFAIYYTFQSCTGITSLDFSSLQSIEKGGIYYAFQNCTGITTVDFSSLQSIGATGMMSAFQNCTGITSLDFSSLQSISIDGIYSAFRNCTGITTVDFSSLQSIGVTGMMYAFQSCTKLTAISFPSLTSVQINSFGSSATNSTFRYCNALTEMHFRADMQETIEALPLYSTKFGATNATIYFDL